MKTICFVLVTVATSLQATSSTNRLEHLTLDQALEMAENLQPELAAARARVEAAKGRARQAGAFPNPEAIVGALQLPVSSENPNEREVRLRGLEVKRREIHRRVGSAFATALYQEQAYQAQLQIKEHSAKAVAITQARVELGDALREDMARVQMELATAEMELHRVQALREQALVVLASAIGDAALEVASLDGTMEVAFDIPTLESLAANLYAQPEMALACASDQILSSWGG